MSLNDFSFHVAYFEFCRLRQEECKELQSVPGVRLAADEHDGRGGRHSADLGAPIVERGEECRRVGDLVAEQKDVRLLVGQVPRLAVGERVGTCKRRV